MVSLSVMKHSKITSGALLLGWLREAHNIHKLIVHALQWQKLNLPQVLETITFVNRETQTMHLIEFNYIPMTHSGMARSVRVGAVRVPSLPHAWFSVQLPAPTTDMIEVSICCDQDTMDEDTPVELIEIYMQ